MERVGLSDPTLSAGGRIGAVSDQRKRLQIGTAVGRLKSTVLELCGNVMRRNVGLRRERNAAGQTFRGEEFEIGTQTLGIRRWRRLGDAKKSRQQARKATANHKRTAFLATYSSTLVRAGGRSSK